MNIPKSILDKINMRLHLQRNHPLNILKNRIDSHFQGFKVFDDLNPIVSTKQNFDDLLIPADHPGRKLTDTFYFDSQKCLRTHTSAHQKQVLSSKASHAYLITGDVYRRDEIDPTHYPIFHQVEGIRLFDRDFLDNNTTAVDKSQFVHSSSAYDIKKSPLLDNHSPRLPLPLANYPVQLCHTPDQIHLVSNHLRKSIEDLMYSLFSPDLQMRWVDAYFPFTSPSWELEANFNGKWLELCGCGIMQQQILTSSGNDNQIGWAFGFGLERIAMILFQIPDIRLFWSTSRRFLDQFQDGKFTIFKPFSKYPVCYKDIAFWCSESFHDNDFAQVVRNIAGDLVEQVILVGLFNPGGSIQKSEQIEQVLQGFVQVHGTNPDQ
jgi:phenylalanyl-tRNA synthetase alpha chain